MNTIRRRVKRKGFTSISNDALDNPELSLKAKGLLAIFLSQKEGWVFYLSELVTRSADGKDAFNSALRELEAHRYVVKAKMKTAKGRFAPNEYLFDDVPLTDEDIEGFYNELENANFSDEEAKDRSGFSAAEKPSTDLPQRVDRSGESAANNTNNNQPNDNKTNDNKTDEKGGDEFNFPTDQRKANQGRTRFRGRAKPTDLQSNEAKPIFDVRVNKILANYSRVVKEKTGYSTDYSSDEAKKSRLLKNLDLYKGRLDTIETYVVWLCDNWNAIKETNDLLKSETYPPLYLLYSSHYFNQYYPLYEKGDKVKRPFDANKLANERAAKARDEGQKYEVDMEGL